MRTICVTGWYYPQAFYDVLAELSTELRVIVMAHRPPTCVLADTLLQVRLPDVGLEWGSYSAYLTNWWLGGETLFLHDDISVTRESLLQLFRARGTNHVDLAFVFTDEAMATRDCWHHGRAILASDKYLQRLKDGPGIWFDADNHGVTTGPGCNRGCHHFYFTMGTLKEEDPTLRTTLLLAPDMQFGFRGLMGDAGQRAASERFALQAAAC